MKKFLTFAVLIFSLTFAQFSQAQSYTPQEGDKAIFYNRGCHWCYNSYSEKQFYRNKQLIAEDKPPRYGCKNDPHHNGEHAWSNTATATYYIFTNGNWKHVTDY